MALFIMESGGEQMLRSRELKRAALQGDHLSKSGWWVAQIIIASSIHDSCTCKIIQYRELTELSPKMHLLELLENIFNRFKHMQ